MSQTWLLLGFVLAYGLLPAQSAAKYEPPNLKGEVFAGYSLVSARPGRDLDRTSLHGWTATVTSYQTFARWGLTAEFGGTGGDLARQQSFLFGGAYRSVQRRRWALTGRILSGVTRLPNQEQTAFSVGFGQAIDVKLSEQWALRAQPDLRFVRIKDPGGASRWAFVRPFSIGLAYKFGRR